MPCDWLKISSFEHGVEKLICMYAQGKSSKNVWEGTEDEYEYSTVYDSYDCICNI